MVALKIVKSGDLADPAELSRFAAEAQAVARLHHPNVVTIHHFGTFNDLPFFVLEFCGGGSLANQMSDGPLEPRRAAVLVEAVVRGIAYCHLQNILHRDLKPANILVADDGTPKVTDFGLAKEVDAGLGLTVSGGVLGTPAFMSPEQAGGHTARVDVRTDVYGLGACLYCLVVRQTAVPRRDDPRDFPPGTTRQPCPSLAAQFEYSGESGHRMSEVSRKRFLCPISGCCRVGRRFTALLNGEPVLAQPPGKLERMNRWLRRHRTRVAVACVLLALFIGGLTSALLWKSSEAKREKDRRDTLHRLQAAAVNNEQIGLAEMKADRYESALNIFAEATARLSLEPELGELYRKLAARTERVRSLVEYTRLADRGQQLAFHDRDVQSCAALRKCLGIFASL